ncbi:nuclear receptor-interacting protein 1 [Neosynchiropus ocellatus]
MTHGEEPGPETHKDSAVLTYLEGLLMHPVVAGPGAAASRRSEAAHSNQEQAEKVGGSFQLPSHGPTAPKAGTNGPTHGASQHLKKARLLRSEAWNNQGNQRIGTPPAEMNGQVRGLQNGSLEGSPQGGESTLLASLLQSFSSRLQSVALSQNTVKPPSECSSPSKVSSVDKEPLPVYGTASSRLKGLMRKSKLQNHSNTPYSRRGQNQDRTPESPRSAHSATPPAPSASESVSCAERLKAVANMVKIRSSPAPSPKPSVACSQLALLLSSEAHLQQYSREHALKAQLSGRSASERLAAMANQQLGPEKRPASVGGTHPVSTDAHSSLTTQNGMNNPTTITATVPQATLSSPRSPSLPQSHHRNSPPTPPHMANHIHAQPLKEKRAPWPVTQKRDPPTLVKQEPESPARWSGQENEEEDGCDSNPDSPRLSRSNPILYYMLQKGSLQLRKEIKDQKEGTHSVVRVKEEPISDMHAYEQNLSSTPQSPSHTDKHSHENQGLSQSSE